MPPKKRTAEAATHAAKTRPIAPLSLSPLLADSAFNTPFADAFTCVLLRVAVICDLILPLAAMIRRGSMRVSRIYAKEWQCSVADMFCRSGSIQFAIYGVACSWCCQWGLPCRAWEGGRVPSFLRQKQRFVPVLTGGFDDLVVVVQ